MDFIIIWVDLLPPTKYDWREVLPIVKDETWNNIFVYTNMKLFITNLCLGQ